MAEVYQRAQAELTTSFATVYTVPGATSSVMIGCRLSNIGASSVNVDIKVGASGSTKRIIGADTPLPVGSSLSALSGDKLILEAGEILEAKASSNTQADIIVSILEIS
tara:strand:- start:60 stop:383 length:324 start_codon:yes stop_codon:yes gene_type:complete